MKIIPFPSENFNERACFSATVAPLKPKASSLFSLQSPSFLQTFSEGKNTFNQKTPTNEDAVRLLVFHSMETQDIEESLFLLTDKKSGVSAHYLIDGNGTVYCLVDEEKRAWHAGVAAWREWNTDINSVSIGIEFQNTKAQGFTSAQIDSGIRLSKEILKRHPLIKPVNIVAHSDIAPLRKKDPDEHFPWRQLAQSGIGLWTQNQRPVKDAYLQKTEEELLLKIGYLLSDSFLCADTKKTPSFSFETKKAFLTAFCRRFSPENLTTFLEKAQEEPSESLTVCSTPTLFNRLAAVAELYDSCQSL